MTKERFDVLGVGNAVVDVFTHTDTQFLTEHQITKGSMSLIESTRAEYLYHLMSSRTLVSGGSAANTIAGLASLESRCAFIGKVSNDHLGQFFRRDMQKLGVTFQTTPIANNVPTAQSLIFVTPDADRTMNTFLGASFHLSPQDLDETLIQNSKISYLEGYLQDHPDKNNLFLKVAHIAHQSNQKIALSLSDPLCVDRHRRNLQSFVSHHSDLVFSNEEEALSLYQTHSLAQAINALQQSCPLAVITRGAQTIIVITSKNIEEIPTEPVSKLIDTTGAGDQFAAGFLYGFTHNKPADTCARLGAICAAEVISHNGARPHKRITFLEDSLPSINPMKDKGSG